MQDGSNLRKVPRELNICKTSVRNIRNKFWDTGSVVDKSRSGRPPKCSERDTRLLSLNATKEPFLSAHNLGVQSNLISMVSVRYLAGLPKWVQENRSCQNYKSSGEFNGARHIRPSKLLIGIRLFFWINQGSAISVVHGVMFGDREIADTTAIIPARQLNVDAYHCWFGRQLEVMAKESWFSVNVLQGLVRKNINKF